MSRIPCKSAALLLSLPFLAIATRAAAQNPYAAILYPRDTIHWYSVAPLSIPFIAGPRGARIGTMGHIAEVDAMNGAYLLIVDNPIGTTLLTIKSLLKRSIALSEKILVAEEPALYAAAYDGNGRLLDNGTSAWSGLHAKVGEVYDPSTEWASIDIPAAHYQTIVSISGVEVLNAPGTRFHRLSSEIARRLTVTATMRPEDIVTSVYWRPMGTADRERWVLLLSNRKGTNAIIQPSTEMTIE